MSFDWRQAPSEELERHFNPRLAVTGAADLIAGYTSEAEAARRELAGEYDLRYGERPKQTYDLHRAESAALGTPSPVLIFIHGGYWRALDKDDHSWFAPAFVKAGISVVNLNYDLCPSVSLDVIVEEMREAIRHLHGNLRNLGGDPDRLFLAGHSAGAHLAAMLLSHDWLADGLPADVIRGVTCISGIFEPEVVMHTTINEDVRLDLEMARRNDCLARPPLGPTPMIVVAGGAETPGWIQQSRDYVEVCRTAGVATELMLVEGANHFTVVMEATRPETQLFLAILAQVGGEGI